MAKRKRTYERGYMYSFVNGLIKDMEIGDRIEIEVPENLNYFRKYLYEISIYFLKRKFTTKVVNGKLHVMRVPYFTVMDDISSKQEKKSKKIKPNKKQSP